MKIMFHFILFSLFHDLIAPVAAASVNITVDDTLGNNAHAVLPTYVPLNDTWHAGSPSEDCSVCVIKPYMLDMSQIMNQTWHHGAHDPGNPIHMEVTFPGTAVYVYYILPNTLPGQIGYRISTNLSFSMDGETVGRFSHISDSSITFLYNQLVYSNTSLSNATHSLVIIPDLGSLLIFDYLIYTVETETLGSLTSPSESLTSPSESLTLPSETLTSHSPTPSAALPSARPSSHPMVAAIVGPVVGVVAVILLAVAAVVFILRRERRRLERLPDSSFSSVGIIPPSTNPSFDRPVSLSWRSSIAEASTFHGVLLIPSRLTEFSSYRPTPSACHVAPDSICPQIFQDAARSGAQPQD